MIASTTETNFARQFSSVSLVHRMETNIERQFFEVCPFIFAAQQNLLDALTNVSRAKLLSIRRRWQIKSRPSAVEHIAKNVRLHSG
jgi:hypothetical protein